MGAEFIPHHIETNYRSPMPKISAGLLMYRVKDRHLQVLLVHPGGPFFQNKDDGAWSIPKGEPSAGEELFDTAQREFEEETGFKASPPFIELSPITQKGGKVVHAGPSPAAAIGATPQQRSRSNGAAFGTHPRVCGN
jgi:predicted NUDIX family NTP pyrophosphohydrolase